MQQGKYIRISAVLTLLYSKGWPRLAFRDISFSLIAKEQGHIVYGIFQFVGLS